MTKKITTGLLTILLAIVMIVPMMVTQVDAGVETLVLALDTEKVDWYAWGKDNAGSYRALPSNPPKGFTLTYEFIWRAEHDDTTYSATDIPHSLFIVHSGGNVSVGYEPYEQRFFIQRAGFNNRYPKPGDSDWLTSASYPFEYDRYYRFDFYFDTNKVKIACNGEIVLDYTVSGFTPANNYVIMNPKRCYLWFTRCAMYYNDKTPVWDHVGKNSLNGFSSRTSIKYSDNWYRTDTGTIASEDVGIWNYERDKINKCLLDYSSVKTGYKMDETSLAKGTTTVARATAQSNASSSYTNIGGTTSINQGEVSNKFCLTCGLIENIGTVTLNSNSAITAAEDSYNGLSAAQKNGVSNYSKLTAARTEYGKQTTYKSKVEALSGTPDASTTWKNKLKAASDAYTMTNTSAVADYKKTYDSKYSTYTSKVTAEGTRINNLINAIGTVTLDSRDAIIAAENAINSSTNSLWGNTDVQAKVNSTQQGKVTSARSSYNTLVTNEGKRINNLINKSTLSTVTLDSRADIIAAENAINSETNANWSNPDVQAKVNSTQQGKVTTARSSYNTLVTTEGNRIKGLITAIGTVSLDSRAAIIAAEESMNTSTNPKWSNTDVQAKISSTNRKKVTTARSTYTGLVTAEAERIVGLIDAATPINPANDTALKAAEAAVTTEGNTNWSNPDVSAKVAADCSGYSTTLTNARADYKAVHAVYSNIENIDYDNIAYNGYAVGRNGTVTTAFNGKTGVRLDCNKSTTSTELTKGNSKFVYEGAETFTVGSDVTFRVCIKSYSTSKPFWGLTINGYTVGYDFANSRFGIQTGALGSNSKFVPDVAWSRTVTLAPDRFYDIKFLIRTDLIAVQVDGEYVLYTTKAKKDPNTAEYLKHNPRHVSADYNLITWTLIKYENNENRTPMSKVSESNLVSNTCWTGRGAFFSTEVTTFDDSVKYKDSNTEINTNAKSKFDALTPERQAMIPAEKVTKMTTAVETYAALKDTKSKANSAVGNASKFIDAIGDVEMNSTSQKQISDARKKYNTVINSYSEFVANVYNASVLTAAETTYNDLCQAEANKVISKINAIGTVTLAKRDKLLAAEQANNDCTYADARAKIDNLGTLTSARTTYDGLVTAEVSAITGYIDAIGTVELDDGDRITAAEGAVTGITNEDVSTGVTSAYRTILADARVAFNTLTTVVVYEAVSVDPTSSDVVSAYEDFYDLTAEQIALIENYAEVKAQIDEAKAEYDAINPVYAAVAALDATPSLAEGDADIAAAETSYGALTPARQAKVDAANDVTLAQRRAAYNALVPTVNMSGTLDSSKIKSNLYFTIKTSEIDTDEERAAFTITFSGQTYSLAQITETTLSKDKEYTNFILHATCPAKDMSKSFNYSISAYGKQYRGGTTTVAAYATKLLTYENSNATTQQRVREVARTMLEYGKAAEVYFGVSVSGGLASNNDVSLPSATVVAPAGFTPFDGDALKRDTERFPAGYLAISVTCKSDTTLSIAFFVHTGYTKAQAKEWLENPENVTFDGAAVTAAESGNYLVISKQNVAVRDIKSSFDLVVAGKTYKVSVLDYLIKAQTSTTKDSSGNTVPNTKLRDLTKGLFAYATAAKTLG